MAQVLVEVKETTTACSGVLVVMVGLANIMGVGLSVAVLLRLLLLPMVLAAGVGLPIPAE